MNASKLKGESVAVYLPKGWSGMTEKRKILFVDDETDVLNGLEKSLTPMADLWYMAFVKNGQTALKLLEQEKFDVILSDMVMPGMDGSQLLDVVCSRYPSMVRILLCERSGQDMIVKSAQQYLPKPCDRETLVFSITRACSLKSILDSRVLKGLLGRIENLPSIPALYGQIVKELSSKDASAASVGDIIAKDMGMTAKVLQLINSSFFGMPRHISSANEAVILLGIDVVKTLILGIEVFSRFDGALSVISVNQIHDHCARTAIMAKQIALLENMEPKTADNAMICAILHDLGKLLLAENFPDEYKQAVDMAKEKDMAMFHAEKAAFGVTHSEVGAYLLGLWGLPRDIIEGIAFHHRPGRVVSNNFELSGLVHVADLLEHHEKQGRGPDMEPAGLDRVYLEKLGLAHKVPMWQAQTFILD
ncbi:MAG: response regulator [Pseudomonadota bacterium]